MKVLKYLKSFALFLPLIGLFSCAEDLDDFNINSDSTEGVIVSISLPEDIVSFLSRGTDDDISDISIKNLYVVQYSGDTFLQLNEVNPGDNIVLDSNGNYTFPFVFHSSTNNAEFIANMNDIELDLSALSAGTNSKRAWEIATSNFTLWGKANITSSSNNMDVQMKRNYAKLNVESEADGFEIIDFNLYGQATSGTIAPNSSTTHSDGITLPSPVNYLDKTTSQSSDIAAGGTQYMFETPSSQEMFVILKAKYNGKEYYYKASFAKRKYKDNTDKSPSDSNYPDEIVGNYSYEYQPVVRNHRYVLKIDYVHAEGFEKKDDAIEASPDNRLTVELVDQNTEILDIIACRDYALGVSASQLSAKGEADTHTFYVVHNFKLGPTYPEPSIKISYPEGTTQWLTSATVDLENKAVCEALFETDGSATGEPTASTNSKTAYKYPVVLTFPQNTDDENSRTVEIIVSVGDLSRTVTFTQEARDYLRGEDRKVLLWIPTNSTDVYDSPVTVDYFAWIDQRNRESGGDFCYGVRKEDNRGKNRTDGLIFPPVNIYNGNSVKYYIPQLDGDTYTTPEDFTVTPNIDYGGKTYYELKQTSPSTELGISNNRKFTIKNESATINYTIYTTGFFHQLTSDQASIQCNSIDPKTGWFYYEFVKKGELYILDRNIGAESNQPYISTYIGYYNYSGAIGAYFQVATKRASSTNDDTSAEFWNYRIQSDGTIIDDLKMGFGSDNKFHIPTKGDLATLTVTLGKPATGVTGNASYVATISNLTTSLVKDSRVFIPHGGYYEGNSLRLPTRADLWTSTLYSEPQGYHPNYNTYKNTNYGYWYYYLDAQPVPEKTNVFSQIRCTDSTSSDFSADATIYRYMPIRLVWGDAVNGDGTSTDENYFKSDTSIEVKWGNNYFTNNTTYWYRKIYVSYTTASGTKVEPFGTFDAEDNVASTGDGKTKVSKTFTLTAKTDLITIIVHDGQNSDEMRYEFTPGSIQYKSGTHAGKKPQYSGSDPSYVVDLW